MTKKGLSGNVCWICDANVTPSKAWVIKLANGERSGCYCSKKCADNDTWGPRFNGAVSVKAAS